MKDENKIIQSLWIGPSLSPLERLSLHSFLYNGHQVHLYVYRDIPNIPPGVIVMDAHDIVPEKEIFLGQRNNGIFDGYEAFSDFFRYTLLYKEGGWWSDLDVICLQPFDFPESHLFASHFKAKQVDENVVSGCVMKLPQKSREAAYCLDACNNIKDKNTITYSGIGPRLVTEMTDKFNLHSFIQPPHVFCPIQWWEINRLIIPNRDFQITPVMYGIHCFNVRWTDDGFDKHKRFHTMSVFEQLKEFYGVE
jgi:hypothetical protein